MAGRVKLIGPDDTETISSFAFPLVSPVTPELSNGRVLRLKWTTTGAKTVNAPLNLGAAVTASIIGMHIWLDIINSSGGVVTITLDAVYKQSGYVDPANGKRRTAEFYYDGTDWVQLGAWSPDL